VVARTHGELFALSKTAFEEVMVDFPGWVVGTRENPAESEYGGLLSAYICVLTTYPQTSPTTSPAWLGEGPEELRAWLLGGGTVWDGCRGRVKS